MIALVPLAAAATTNYYTSIVAPTHPTGFWPLGPAESCAANDNTAGPSLAGCIQVGTSTRAAPFPDDVDNQAINIGRLSNLGITRAGYGSEFAVGMWVWVKHGQPASWTSGRNDLWTSNQVCADGGCYTTRTVANALYLNTPDNWATLCFGQVGGPGQCNAGGWLLDGAWNFLLLVYVGGTFQLFSEGQLVHTLTITTAPDTSGDYLFGAECECDTDYSAWGLGWWQGSAAAWLGTPCGSTNPICAGGGNTVNGNPAYPAMLLYTAQVPTVTAPIPQPVVGACPSGTSKGGISAECKFLIPTMSANDCTAPSSIWDIGSDIGYGLCELGDVFIVGINGVISGLNYLVDLIEPGPSATQPFSGLWQALQTHVPFSYVANTVSALTTAIGTAGSTHAIVHFPGSATGIDLTSAMSSLGVIDVPMAGVFLAGVAVDFMHRVRDDVSEDH